MVATDEMVAIALKTEPHAACLVPERREERTTEGGLDVAGQHNMLASVVARLVDAGIRVSLFIAAEPRQIESAARVCAPVIEIHTGPWCDGLGEGRRDAAEAEWHRILTAPRSRAVLASKCMLSYARFNGVSPGLLIVNC